MIAHLAGRERAPALLGWTGRKAGGLRWRAFTAASSPARRRARFLDTHHERTRRLVRALIEQGIAPENTPPGLRATGRVCRVFSRRLYRALGVEDIRHRRIASPTLHMRRLLSLDYVLEHPDLWWLPTEPETVGAFEALGVERRLLPWIEAAVDEWIRERIVAS
ncbi:MAG: hypothetical protein OXT72_09540 [Gammaproteobacteria bacterium]|nr:hypothetical protein [Gammaproteobacteria bacterium]MDE0246443.1 hypothetical protein [Gammaproteobacteria bacterium]